MLDAIMKVTFFPKEGDLYRDWPGYRVNAELRPHFNLGGTLWSGQIVSDEDILAWDREYTVLVRFFTLFDEEGYAMVRSSLCIGQTYPIQIASRVIGRAEMVDFSFSA